MNIGGVGNINLPGEDNPNTHCFMLTQAKKKEKI